MNDWISLFLWLFLTCGFLYQAKTKEKGKPLTAFVAGFCFSLFIREVSHLLATLIKGPFV
jgi:hypothetical protein